MLGAIYALLSAATFGLNNASLRRGVITSTVFQALAVTVPLGVPLFALAVTLGGQWPALLAFEATAYGCLALAGILHFVWGRYCGYRAIKAMGGNLASPVQQGNMIVAMTLAIVFLGEHLNALRVLGIVLVFVGPAIALPSRRQRARWRAAIASAGSPDREPRSDAESKPAFTPNLVEGYTFAILSATGYGLSPVLVRFGLEATGASFAGGLISYAAATLFFGLFLVPRGRLAHVLGVDRGSVRWFAISGVFVFFAQMFRYMALAIAPVTVVSPIQRTSGIFRVIFTTILNRDHEILNARLIVGILISLLGAVALTVSVDMVAQWVSLPPALVDWRWP
jgi:uncharacterized membrane protein